jgi:N-acetylglucosamine-6-phosphate deacetylase
MPITHSQAVPVPTMILAHRLFDGETMLGPSMLEIREGRIVAVHPPETAAGDVPVTVLPKDTVLAPGFIDTQVNGGGGVLLNDDPSARGIRAIAAAHRRFGTTGLLPTLITDSPETMTSLLAAAESGHGVPGVLGFHLEGPFLNPARKGIHPLAHIREISPSDVMALCQLGALGSSLVTLAPECVPPAIVRALVAAGLRISIGHSAATGEQARAALDDGATGVTHLFNAMSQMTAREPGIVGAALALDALYAGIICDGLHVDPLALKAAFRAKGRERLMLVTDAMPLVGTDATSFQLQGRTIKLADKRLTDDAGTLAGAHLTMFDAVRNAVRMMDIPLEDALRMASTTPADFLGVGHARGRLAPGYRADLVAFNDVSVVGTWMSEDWAAMA